MPLLHFLIFIFSFRSALFNHAAILVALAPSGVRKCTFLKALCLDVIRFQLNRLDGERKWDYHIPYGIDRLSVVGRCARLGCIGVAVALSLGVRKLPTSTGPLYSIQEKVVCVSVSVASWG